MNFYTVYRVHNYHFVVYGAMFLGQDAPAIAAANELIETMPEAMLRIPSPPMADLFESFVAIKQHCAGPLRQVGRRYFEQALARGPAILLQHGCGDEHYAEGVAHAALGNVRGGAGRTGAVPRRLGSAYQRSASAPRRHPVERFLAIAEEMLEGEIAYRRRDHETAFARLHAAIALEDDLPYAEPWGWMQPIRHALGALLLEQDRAAEAEVYREDLGLGRQLCPAPRSTPTTSGPCAACSTVSTAAAKLWNRPSSANG